MSNFNLLPIASALAATIRNRMAERQLRTHNIDEGYVQFLLPQVQTEATMMNYRALVENHAAVDDTTMVSLLSLRESLPSSEIAAPGVVQFYIRSWTLTADHAQALVDGWVEGNVFPEEAEHIANYLAAYPGQNCHVRYVGTCISPTRPIDRMLADITARNTGVLAGFVRLLIQEDLLNTGRCYEFVSAALPSTASQNEKDIREQVLVAFFGLGTLLNRQPGGFYTSFLPTEDVFRNYQTLGCRFFAKFREAAVESQHNLEPWIELIQESAQQDADITRVARQPFSSELLQTTLQQALPRPCNNHTILVCIGDSISLEGYLDPQPFLSGRSRAGQLTRDFLSRLEAWEEGQYQWSAEALDTQPFPFVDLYPWLGVRGTTHLGLHQLGHYLRTVKPLVTVSFSKRVTSCALSNFVHTYGMRGEDKLVQLVGVPRLVSFADPSWINNVEATEPPAGCSTLVVPHIHPGNDKHGPHAVELRRLLDLTWQVTLYVATLAMELSTSFADRDQLCRHLLRLSAPDSQDLSPALAQLYIRLEEARAAYTQFLATRLETLSASVRGARTVALQRSAERRLERLGQAVGEPGSADRRQQVGRMWNANIPDYHVHISRQEEARWRQWAMTRREGTFYFASAVRSVEVPERHRLYNVLVRFPPPGAEDNTWMSDDAQVEQALSRWAQFMRMSHSAEHFSPERQREIRIEAVARADSDLDRSVYEYRDILEGRLVNVQRTGILTLRWLNNGTQRDLNIQLNRRHYSQSVQSRERQFNLRFIDTGIALETTAGVPVRFDPTMAGGCVFSLDRMGAHAQSNILLRLWRQERERLTGVAQQAPRMTVPPGRKAFQVRTKESTMNEFGEIRPEDYIWLLREYLDRRFPRGGTLCLALREYDVQVRPGTRLFVDDFERFLADHLDHPRAPEWQLWLSNMRRYSRNIPVNVKFLRPSMRKYTEQKRIEGRQVQWQNLTFRE